MNKKRYVIASVFLALALVATSVSLAKDPKDTKRQGEALDKVAGTPRYAVLNINNLTAWFRSDGQSNHSPQADNGLYYPRNTGNVIYQDGVVYGGKAYVGNYPESGGAAAPRQLVRVNGGTYGVGTRAGWVTGSGATAAAKNPNDADVRIYRIRRDYASMSMDELRRDAADVNEIRATDVNDAQVQAVLDQYAKDWDEWPVAAGAPYIDRNGNGVYDKPPAFSANFTVDSLIAGGYDEPGVAGRDLNSPADQVIWTAYNDLNVAQATGFVFSEPLGIEVQKTVWGYKRSDAMGNLYFARYRLINKGGVDTDAASGDQLGSFYIDSMYVCQWSDPDLGSFSDDLAGCDSLRSLGFIYNGNAIDATYRAFSLAPPSGGYDFLAGPTITGAPTDSAVVNLKRVYGKRNLGMSSFAYFSAGSPYSDPCNAGTAGYACNTGQWWKMLRGYAPLGTIDTPDQPYAHPTTNITKFPLSGDPALPASNTNFIDGQGTAYSFAPGDRRILLNTGPFRMAPGDTQEIYVGTVVGLGGDRLSSVAIMKANDNAVQITFDLLFQVSRPPAAPNVTVAELDGKVILEWGSDLNKVRETELTVSQPGQYEFEGYNVYQLPSRGSRVPEEAVRIATYDKVAEPRVIFDTRFDPVSGQFVQVPIQFGSNSGIRRNFIFDRDYVLDVDKIYNGQEYYLVVTAYSHAKVAGFTTALESSPNVLTVRPKVPFGVKINASYLDTISTVRTAGTSDGSALALVINPSQVTGDSYQIRFDANGGPWRLVNTTKGDTVLKNQTNQTGDETSPIVDGMMVKIFGPPNDFKDFLEVANANGPHAPTYAAFQFNGSGFPSELFPGAVAGNGSDRPAPNVAGAQWGIHTGNATGDQTFDFSYSTFVSRTTQGGARWSRIIPYDWEIRFTAAGGTGFEPNAFVTGASTGGTVIPVPFELWRTGINTPADASDDVRLFPYLIDWNANGQWDFSGVDHTISGGTNDPETDWIYWVLPKNQSPGQAGYNAIVTDVTTNTANHAYLDTAITAGTDVMRRMVFVLFNGGDVTDPTFPNNIAANRRLPETGQIFRIISTKINTPADVFTINTSAKAPTKDASLEKVSAEKIGVFPNPYYAYNAAETNRFDRFVTFNNLPPKATVRIFNLAGQLVRKLEKNDASQYLRWSLTNSANFPVASGIYVAYIEAELPSTGEKITKTLKLAIIQEQEILNTY
ncbi:MAG TPA: T9SS type A sorting domain-containing protein [Bacteroidota bacterium]|nr:T9SS type A sorting domain-containing protein [Bacteroidota bacterium]